MRSYLLIFLLVSTSAFGQDRLVNKIEKELGGEFYSMRTTKVLQEPVRADEIKTLYSPSICSLEIGKSYLGEFIGSDIETTSIAYVGNTLISKAEFLEFRKWIQDSIARDKIYFSIEDDTESARWIRYENEYFSERSQKMVKFDPSNRDENRVQYHLDWSKRFQYDDPELVPILADMYYPQPQRFRRKKIIDERKLFYESNYYDSITAWNHYPILMDRFNFALKSKHPFDIWSVYAYLNEQLDLDSPMTNIEPFMAELFCEWKSNRLNEKIGGKKSDYKILLRLPTAQEVVFAQTLNKEQTEIPAFNPTENWKITNNELRDFAAHTLDSITRIHLFFELKSDEEALKLRNLNSIYFSEGHLEFVEINPEDRDINFELSTLNYDARIKKTEEYYSVVDKIEKKYSDGLLYTYSWMDGPSRGLKGSIGLIKNERPRYGQNEYSYRLLDLDSAGHPFGEDLNLGNNFSGRMARDHENLQRFIHREDVIIPNLNSIPTNDEIADISYEQALAYYNWKYRIDLYNEGDDGNWQQFVFPSEEEFNHIIAGNSIEIPAQKVEYDYSTFRVVIELIPK